MVPRKYQTTDDLENIKHQNNFLKKLWGEIQMPKSLICVFNGHTDCALKKCTCECHAS